MPDPSAPFPAEALPPACALRTAGTWTGPAHGHVALTYAERVLHRKRLETQAGETFVLDLPVIPQVNHGDALELTDGRLIEIVAASEALIEIRADNLAAVAWHLGSRHVPCQTAPDRLLISAQAEAMLAELEATLDRVFEPFNPLRTPVTLGHHHPHQEDAISAHSTISRTGKTQIPERYELPDHGPFDDTR